MDGSIDMDSWVVAYSSENSKKWTIGVVVLDIHSSDGYKDEGLVFMCSCCSLLHCSLPIDIDNVSSS
jgi:hypothetical protein